MDKKGIYVLLAIVFVIIMCGAAIGYNYLSKEYQPEGESGIVGDATDQKESEEQNQSETPDMKAPDFTVYDLEGNQVTLHEQFGKPIVVNFWATWCGPCKSEMPAFDKVYKNYGDDIIFMMVNMTDGVQDTKEKVEAFLEEDGYQFPVYLDSDLSATYTYGVNSVPATLFIDEEGNVVNARLGAMSEELLQTYLEQLFGV